jgi:glycosyltransferase involved in cell wall biosynthesis
LICPSVVILDSRSAKPTERGGVRGFDGHKRIKGRKRHLLVYTLWWKPPTSRIGAQGARSLAGLRSGFTRIRTVMADGGYESRKLARCLKRAIRVLATADHQTPAARLQVPSREGIEEYQALREEVEAQVGRLNGKYATLRNSPIHFIHGSVEFTDLCAMYALADVALVTPLIYGMNPVAKEYLACQRENSGLLILSKFAGAAEELFDALLVNPYDAPAVAETLSAALALPVKERRMRNQAMRGTCHAIRCPALGAIFY